MTVLIIYFILTSLIMFSVLVWICLYIKKTYLNDYSRNMKIKKIKKKIEETERLPDEDKAQVDPEEIAKLTNTLSELLPKPPVEEITMEHIELTEKIRDIINDMIASEVYAVMRESVALHFKYDLLNITVDVGKVSTNVLQGLNTAVFNTKLVMTSDYIIRYVCSHSYNVLLKTVQEYNASISR